MVHSNPQLILKLEYRHSRSQRLFRPASVLRRLGATSFFFFFFLISFLSRVTYVIQSGGID